MKVVKGSHKGLDNDKNGRLMVKRDMHMCVHCLVVFRTRCCICHSVSVGLDKVQIVRRCT